MQPAALDPDRHRRPPDSRYARSRSPTTARCCFSGAHILRGYWRNEAATAEAIDEDGFFHTGDIGELDDDGFLSITGRKKELIVTAGGKNVAPAVLEDRLRAHPLISQCIVVGDAKPFIACLITLDPDALPGVAEGARQARRHAGRRPHRRSRHARRHPGAPSTRPTTRSARPRRSASS